MQQAVKQTKLAPSRTAKPLGGNAEVVLIGEADMHRMNWVRIAAGGFLTGLVIAVFGSIVTAFSRDAWEGAMTALGSPFADPTQMWPAASIAAGTAVQLGMGIVAVWLYAAIRPRLGPGPVTAAITGLIVWLIGAAQTLSLVVLEVLALRHFLVLAGPYAVGWILATMAGAMVYKEHAPESP